MKVISVLKFGFSLVGIALLAGAMMLYKNTNNFLDNAVSETGTVVDLVKVRGDNSITYKPVVEFTARDGQKVEFTSSVSSNPPSHSVGEIVEVLYLPSNVQAAKINSYARLWGGFLVTLVLGVVFSLVGGLIFFVGMLRRRKKDHLQRNGVVVEATVQSVVNNYSVSINGKSPFMIQCQWLDPATSELHLFESENIWFDPSGFINDEKIKVFVERNNLKKYHVDISFLPKLKS
ncbi:hypothetical protein QF017_005927 [Pseudomonas laurylsulfatiphila]|uniref:DUF3592 domain-containing protein n=1 Tax=Pseudomonas laurylsulfatiphila TaxID=2011015 RepID=UPI003D1CFC90